AALGDPNPLARGGGARLSAAGVRVELGLLADEAERQNRAWLTATREGRPHVTLKAAATLDGKLADVHGGSRWITGEPARLRATTREGRVDVVALLARLFERDVRAVLLEGGGETHAAFLDAGVVDRVTLFLAPLLLGGREAPGVVGGAGRDLKSAVRLGPVSVTPLGDDLLLEADVVKAAR